MPRGTITSWDTSRGRGAVQLEDGTELPFDASIVTTGALTPGLEAEVVTAIGVSGQLKARLVLVDEFAVEERPFEDGFDDLQLLGLLSGWSLHDARAAVADGAVMSRESAAALLLTYYGEGSVNVRAASDRVLVLDEHLGDAPKIPLDALASLAAEALRPKLLGSVTGTGQSLGAVLNAFNAVLQHAGVGQHFFLVDLDSDRYVMVVARNDAFARAAHSSVLRIVS
ncbi:MAG: hypothetical protein JNJ54_24585 [Myxococcaceae bacterium]|nr:hypothetical protein [Myxococcaceae bacterium]